MIIAKSAPDPFVVPDDLDQVSYGGNCFPNGKAISSPRLNAGESTGVFIVAGQSNCCNSVDTSYTPINFTKIDNFNIYDGGTYRASDPLLGCTIRNSSSCGNVFGRFADKLINAGKYQRVILAPIGYSGSPIARWRNGGVLNRRLSIAPRRLAGVGLSVTAFLWMQGESDNVPYATSQADYRACLDEVIATPRGIGYGAPWLVGLCTYIVGTTSLAVRAAQASVVNGTNIFAGADTDTLTGTSVNRQADDTHLKAAGAEAAAELWKSAIMAAI